MTAREMSGALKSLLPALVLATMLPGVAAGYPPGPGGHTLSLRLSPGIIRTGTSFPGAQVELTGRAPAGSQVFVKLIARGDPVSLAEKGREGIFWQNRRTVRLDGLPSLYEVLVPSGTVPAAVQQEVGIRGSFRELVAGAVITAKTPLGRDERDAFVRALINAKEKKGLYREMVVDFAPDGYFSYRFPLPRDLPAGRIQVLAWAVKDARVVASGRTSLPVERAGLAGYLQSLARNQAPVYGAIALLAALLAGMGIDFLFRAVELFARSVFHPPRFDPREGSPVGPPGSAPEERSAGSPPDR